MRRKIAQRLGRHGSAIAAVAAALVLGGTTASDAQVLFSEDFDTDVTSAWTVNDPLVTDTFADFFFDYSSVGIPAAPNSGGTTRGMMLQANLGTGVFGGFSVSPTGESFTGDFKISLDYWGNTFETPAGDGTSNLSYFGFGTSGAFGNFPGQSDGVWFGVVADGDSGSDYRVYDHDQRDFSYQIPGAGSYDPLIDDFATHPTNLFGQPTRDSDASPLLQSNFGGVTPPAAMQALFPNSNGNAGDGDNDLTDATFAGSLAFEWHQMEIIKEGDMARWLIDGIQIISLDMSPLPPFPGDNILFGHSDITNGSPPPESNAFELLFTLIDNVEVTTLSAAVDNADFDGNGTAGGPDFVTWQRNFPIADGSALRADGDANNDGNVDAADEAIWERQFGTSPAGSVAGTSVPEPNSWLLVAMAALLLAALAEPRRKLARQPIPIRIEEKK